MATILLSAVGAAAGASVGGGFLGLSSVVIGKAIGATLGQAIDNRLLGQGSEPIETGRVDRLRLSGASEGTAIPMVYGRARLGGQVIWSTRFKENTTVSGGGGGKGPPSPPEPEVTSYSYSISLAVALCEGEITRVGRIWADGNEVSKADLIIRVYKGTETQLPDPKIEAVKGAGKAPAYRGIAYVVIEDLDVTQFGNRVPQFSFEVFRPEQPGQDKEVARGTKAVALIPGTGEYAMATSKVHYDGGPGVSAGSNLNSPSGMTDFVTSYQQMRQEMPNCRNTALVVSWFGDDLRCGNCQIRPRVEQKQVDGKSMPWAVSGVARAQAGLVPRGDDDRPVYGGTPSDQAVKEAIAHASRNNLKATFYPFILMEQMEGNTLFDPWSAQIGQPELPWRGRITTALAPHHPGSPDGSAGAVSQVDAFFGDAQPSDFTVTAQGVDYSGPSEFSYRRFILHYAHLCKSAGGVDAFLIGSELRSLTQIRGPGNSFPVVEQLMLLAADVRGILGAGTKVSYAADWSEYFGYQPQDGTGDVFFHLDPLWSHNDIDFIGIDNYMPLSDWRDGFDHADAGYGTIYNLDYLKANIEGGEGYDWYYKTADARELQIRTPITDGAHGEDWIYRYKDLRGWWENPHHNRVGGVRDVTPTDWQPGSKPFWFTELGCAAIEKGTNQPNKFLDPKSSESALPRYSSGRRDDLMQAQYLRAMYDYWRGAARNPTHGATGVKMLDMDRAHVWAWDTRPFPQFPNRKGLWSDGGNYERGHWLNGRASSRSLASVVSEICERSGVTRYDVSKLYGLVRGYVVDQIGGARAALQPLMLAYGFEVSEREGVLIFASRTGRPDHILDPEKMALSTERETTLERIRAPEAEIAGRVRLNYIENGGSYDIRAVEAIFPDETSYSVSASEIPLILTRAEARAITERWLSEARVARDTASFALPPSELSKGAGDVLKLETDAGTEHFRVDHVEHAGVQNIRAVRVEPGLFLPSDSNEPAPAVKPYIPPAPVFPLFMDLPLLTGDEVPHAPHIAITADPWPGNVALYRSPTDNGFKRIDTVKSRSIVGVTENDLLAASPGVLDRGAALRVKLSSLSNLFSVSVDDMLNGANVLAIGDGSPDNWEVLQFATADLIDTQTYDLSLRLRGQLGTDAAMPSYWPAGSYVVVLDGTPDQIPLASSARGLNRHYRIGPARKAYSDASYLHNVYAFKGIGLRPYAPVHLSVRDDAGDHVINWVRRTRVDGDPWGDGDVPLGETSEQYRVRIVDGPTVKREFDVSSPSWTYIAPLRAAELVSGAYAVEVAQVSERFGAGPFTRLEVDL
ncbi:Putative phage tail protein [Aliiroseovarius halocynthiae]|uniref:Host specificity protein n=1 Tax=Aliiroseovarius halocynthiae TaxID=985055 RepID=A0A545SWU5_9RHOB|nr:glycoside hydrolase/phage tail family protein [Aliiroseovarius halocynthiae]TQV69437.1 host specificity protein [Aliiroseovarius halocynthiae]SMR72831.1 Putative phage tail protein [Aliiroseovarius halocynthiae]